MLVLFFHQKRLLHQQNTPLLMEQLTYHQVNSSLKKLENLAPIFLELDIKVFFHFSAIFGLNTFCRKKLMFGSTVFEDENSQWFCYLMQMKPLHKKININFEYIFPSWFSSSDLFLS